MFAVSLVPHHRAIVEGATLLVPSDDSIRAVTHWCSYKVCADSFRAPTSLFLWWGILTASK